MIEELKAKFARWLVFIGLIVPSLLVSVPAVLAYRGRDEVKSASQWVSHTIEVQQQIQHVLSLLASAESGQRGYLLTSRGVYLDPYHASTDMVRSEVSDLRTLTADNPRQQENLDKLEPLVLMKLAFMAKSISLEQHGDHAAAMALVNSDPGNDTLNSIRVRLGVMEQEEERLLELRQDVLTRKAQSNTNLLWALVVLNVVFAVGMLIAQRRLSKAQSLVTICAWSHTIKYEDEWLSIEEYLHRRFNFSLSHGISPTEMKKVLEQSERKIA